MGRSLVVALDADVADDVALVGGKAASLAVLRRLPGVRVPAGFVVTTAAHRVASSTDLVAQAAAALGTTAPSDPDFDQRCAAMGGALENLTLPTELADQLVTALETFGDSLVAVRSSSPHEDSRTASYAGQYQTYLGVSARDIDAVTAAVKRCWASAYSPTSVKYRLEHGGEAVGGDMAVVLQRQIAAEFSGVMFTADPRTGVRNVTAVEAVPGLGDGLIAGRVTGDTFLVGDDHSVWRVGQDGSGDGDGVGNTERPALTDEDLIALAKVGSVVEHHFGAPQDIEWCRSDGTFWIVQSRPITTLFPLPTAPDDSNRIYLSVGHQQMMTDPIKPLGVSIWQMTSPATVRHAGGRMFVDATMQLTSPARPVMLDLFRRSDPLLWDAVQTVLDRPDFLPSPAPTDPSQAGAGGPLSNREPLPPDRDIVVSLVAESEDRVTALEAKIADKRGVALFEFIEADLESLKASLFAPLSARAIAASHDATDWLNDRLLEWFDEPHMADRLAQAAPDNIVAQMGLDLLELADVIRPFAEIVGVFRSIGRAEVDSERLSERSGKAEAASVEGLPLADQVQKLPGGDTVAVALKQYLDAYGMRCPGEIDITRTRWAESPEMLAGLIVANIDHFPAGEAARRVASGRATAAAAEAEILSRVRSLPDGATKVADTKRHIDLLRTFIGYREYPKYGIVCHYWAYKRALLAEADRWVSAGWITQREDIYYLSFHELFDACRSGQVDAALIAARRDEFGSFAHLVTPRVLTSDGEALLGSYGPDGDDEQTLIGLGVSAGVIEGIARVLTNPMSDRLAPGEILVAAHTDPSWAGLFVTASALVTEVGGLMTHGAVVAREYGLPAVVGVLGATTRIADGQRLRVDGSTGRIEML